MERFPGKQGGGDNEYRNKVIGASFKSINIQICSG
jgi:hypothetical protein